MCELTISQKHIITERNNSKGEYQPAFMQIRIHNSFDGNIDELDVPTLGTLVHEYIHFLQNVSTPWGLEKPRDFDPFGHAGLSPLVTI